MRSIIQGIEATTLLSTTRGDAPAAAGAVRAADDEAPARYIVLWRVVIRQGSNLPRLVPVRD